MADRVPLAGLDECARVGREIGVPEAMAQRGAFRTLALQPAVLKAVYGQLTLLLQRGKLQPRLRELIIMRIGWTTGSDYEWTQHWRIATGLGIPPDDILAVRGDWRASDRLGPADKAVLAAVDDTLREGRISDPAWQDCVAHVGGPAELVEMVVAIGNWTMFSQLLRSLEVPLEEGVASWPPDGKAGVRTVKPTRRRGPDARSAGRLPMVSLAEAERLAGELGMRPSMARVNAFRMLLLNPPLAQAVYGLLVTLLFEGRRLDPRLRELIIMRIGWVTGSEYEWTQHWRFALSVGLDPVDVVGVRDWRGHPGFSAADCAVLAAVDDMLNDGCIADATWQECKAHVGGPGELVEMVVAIGNWTLFSTLLRSLEVPLEEGVAGWPPDGRRPYEGPATAGN